MLLDFCDPPTGADLTKLFGYVQGCTIETGIGPGGRNAFRTTALGNATATDEGLFLGDGIYMGHPSTDLSGAMGASSDFTLADTEGWPLFEIWQGYWFLAAVVLNSDLKVYRCDTISPTNAGILLFTATGAITGGFQRVDLKWRVSTLDAGNFPNSDGYVELFVDNVSVGSASGVPLGYALPEGYIRDVQWNVAHFNPHGRGGLVYLLDGSGTENTDVLPDGLDILTYTVQNGTGTYHEMTPSSGTDHGTLINDTSTSTYLSVTGNAKKTSNPLATVSAVSPKIIRGLKHVASAKKLDSGFRRFRSFLRRGGVDQFHPSEAQLAVDFSDEFLIWETDPFTNQKFTVSRLNQTELGELIG